MIVLQHSKRCWEQESPELKFYLHENKFTEITYVEFGVWLFRSQGCSVSENRNTSIQPSLCSTSIRKCVLSSVLLKMLTDINECTGINLCDASRSDCINTDGSYRCHCRIGFIQQDSLRCGGKLLSCKQLFLVQFHNLQPWHDKWLKSPLWLFDEEVKDFQTNLVVKMCSDHKIVLLMKEISN